MSEHPDDLEYEVIAKTFRSVADLDAHDDMMRAWDRRLAMGEVAKDSPLNTYADEAIGMLSEIDPVPVQDPLELAVSQTDTAAMVLSPDLLVAFTNGKGRDLFDAQQGRRNRMEWLSPRSVDELRVLQQSARGQNNRSHAIIHCCREGQSERLCEAFVLASENHDQAFIVVRSLEHPWKPVVDTQLAEAFNLTAAELGVMRMVFEGKTPTDIAASRGTSLYTVRTQIRTILSKTELNSQVELVRLLGFLCARATSPDAPTDQSWSDPWGNLTLTQRPDGYQVAYSWTGDPDGRPVLLAHGHAIGFMLGEAIETKLREAGIKLIAPCMTGCGGSERNPQLTMLEDDLASCFHIADELDLKDCLGLGFATGGILLLHLSKQRPGTLRSIICFSDCLPLSLERLKDASWSFRTMLRLGKMMPKVLHLTMKSGFRNIRRHGIDWYVKRRYQQGEADRQSSRDPELVPMLRNWCLLSYSMGADMMLERGLQRWEFGDAHMHDLAIPLQVVMGEQEPMMQPAAFAEWAKAEPHFSYEIVADAGELLLHQRPDLVADRIINASKM